MRYSSDSNDKPDPYSYWFFPAVLILWCVFICLVPDPRPLGAPSWAVDLIRSTVGVSEPGSRAIATVMLRAVGLALIGVLLSLSLRPFSLKIAAPVLLIVTPLLAIVCQRINYGYFPVSIQLQLGITSAIVGALIGIAIRRSWIAVGVLVVMMSGLYVWGASTGISDDLADDARATGEYLLANAETIPSGDEGFAKLIELAFLYAKDNSHGTNGVHPNKAAILALGVILGEERVAKVANRPVNIERVKELAAVRSRITLRGRNDLARHFWVSAALVILSDENRSMTVGIGKEMMDATKGGSGFSFVDLTADRAGTLLAVAATKNNANAHNVQDRVESGVVIADFFPEIDGLPEGIRGEIFQSEYGGLGGKETQRLAKEIERRISACKALQTID